EPQAGYFVPAEDLGQCTAAVRGLRADPGRGILSQRGVVREPRDPAQVDEPGTVVASSPTASNDGTCVARTASLFWRDGDAGQFAVLLVGGAWPGLFVDRRDR